MILLHPAALPGITRAAGTRAFPGALLFALHAAALWPVWSWFARRSLETPEEAWGLLALAGAAWVVLRELRAAPDDPAPEGPVPGDPAPAKPEDLPFPTWPTFVPLAAYAALHPWLPPLLRAALALLSVAAWLPRLGLAPRASFQATGFLLLSLPILPTLQFFLGYPLRILAGSASAFLLNLSGYGVVREGTLLLWRDQAVFVDAPCSGVKMIWAGALLALALASRRGAGIRATVGLLAIGVGAVTAGNALRAAGLFFVETGLLRGPAWAQPHAHAAVGMASFLAMAALLLAADGRSRA